MLTSTHGLARAWRKAIRPLTTANVNSVARKLEPKLKRRFLAAVATMQGNVDLEALAESLRVQSAAEALAAVHPETWSPTLAPAAQLLPTAFQQAGQAAASQLSSQLGVEMNFNLTNPRAVQWARTNSARLITEVSGSVKESVREIMGRAFIEGLPPRESAKLIRGVVGLTRRQAEAVMNYRLQLVHAAAEHVGLTAASADPKLRAMAERYAQKLLNQRALTIARTETIASSTRGQQELWRQAGDKGLLDPDTTKREWIVTPDDRLCEHICAPMDEQQVGLEESFVTGEGESVFVPPAHPNCRCAIGLVFVERPINPDSDDPRDWQALWGNI